MVGAAGFEPTTSSTPRKRSTKLSHAPNHNEYYTHPEKDCDIIAAAMTDAFEKYGQRSTAHILKLDFNGAREKEHS